MTKPDLTEARAILNAALTSLGVKGKGRLSERAALIVLHELRIQARATLYADAERLVDELGGDERFSATFARLPAAISRWKDRTSSLLRNLFLAGALTFTDSPDVADLAALDFAHTVQVGYLDEFAKAIADGTQPLDGTLAARAASYGSSVWPAVQGLRLDQALRSGMTHGRRIHKGKDEPCGGCSSEIAKGWQPIDKLERIGSFECRQNCHCVHEFRQGRVAMSDSTATQGSGVATFDLSDPTETAEYVLYPDSKLFEAGDYPDKSYSMTTAELQAAVKAFTSPVPIDLEHTPTVLDGKLGHVRDVRVSEDGREFFGTVAIPRWFDSLLEPGKRKVSCTWDRDSKTLRSLAIVNRPRIADAALMAAFAEANPDEAKAITAVFVAAHSTPHGLESLQAIHDMAARGGALCRAATTPTPSATLPAPSFVSGRERSHLQRVHDLAVKGGAKCAVMSGSAASYSADHPPTKGSRRMSLKDHLKALFGNKPEAAPSDEACEAFLVELSKAKDGEELTPTVSVAATFADSPEARAMQAEIEDLKQKDRLRTIAVDAAAFAAEEIAAGRSLPAERADLIAVFTEAALDDATNPRTVSFSKADGANTTGTRVDALRARHARRPRTILTSELLLPDGLPEGARVVFANDSAKGKDTPTDAEVEKSLAMTDMGRQALALRNGR